MRHRYHDIAFTPTVQDMQSAAGSRDLYAGKGVGLHPADGLGEREAAFIRARDSFYMASVGETGWPYVQHRGGPPGFLKVLDAITIGFADYSGNRQYVSAGNLRMDARVSLFLMDYPNRRRLKMFGRVRVIEPHERAVLEQLEDPDYGAQVERGFLIEVACFAWNCPAHITPRYTAGEVRAAVQKLEAENRILRTQLENAAGHERPAEEVPLGDGPPAGKPPPGAR